MNDESKVRDAVTDYIALAEQHGWQHDIYDYGLTLGLHRDNAGFYATQAIRNDAGEIIGGFIVPREIVLSELQR